MAGAINWLWLQVRRRENEQRVSERAAYDIPRRGTNRATDSDAGGEEEWVVLPPEAVSPRDARTPSPTYSHRRFHLETIQNSNKFPRPSTAAASGTSTSSQRFGHGAESDIESKLPNTDELRARMMALEPSFRESHTRVLSRSTPIRSISSTPSPTSIPSTRQIHRHNSGGDTDTVTRQRQHRPGSADASDDEGNHCLDFISAVMSD